MSVCDGVVNWNHLTNECRFYETKFDKKWSTDRELAEYIVKVSQERYRRVKLPLLWLVISEFKLMKCVDITRHEKACEIATLFIGYLVSGYIISISAYQLMCSKYYYNLFYNWILYWNKCLNNNSSSYFKYELFDEKLIRGSSVPFYLHT